MSRPTWRSLLLILLVTFAVYVPSLGNRFALDDQLQAKAVQFDGTRNTMVAELHPPWVYFAHNYWAGNRQQSVLYRPVTVLSFALTNALTGGERASPFWEAFPHHLINVLLHLWAVMLVFGMIQPLVGTAAAALAGAAVFGLHALHAEVVAGIVGRAELFAFCFGAQALILFQPRAGRPLGGLRGLAVALLLFLAFGSKESALAWIPLLFAYDVARSFCADPSVAWRTALTCRLRPLIAVSLPALVLFFTLRGIALDDVPGRVNIRWEANLLFFVDDVTRISTALVIWCYALLKTLTPWYLVSDYGPVTFDLIDSPLDLRVILSALVLAAVLFGGLRAARRHPLLFLAMASFLGFSAITANVLFATGTIFGERLYYAPSLWLSLAVAWAWPSAGRPSILMLTLLAAWIGACAVVLVSRCPVWHDNQTLFVHDAQVNDRCVRLLERAAAVHSRSPDPAERNKAVAYWKRAIELDPEFAPALMNYGTFLALRGELDEGQRLLERALAVPEHRRTLETEAREKLGLVLLRAGQPERAFPHLERAAAEFADRGDARSALDLYRRLLARPDLPAAKRADFELRMRQLGGQ